MSKLSPEFNKEVYDSYEQHKAYHQSFHSDCSDCYKENRVIQAYRIVNSKTHEDLLKKYPALNNPYGSNYLTGYTPD